MRAKDPRNEALRRVFASTSGAAPGPACPTSDEVWAASRGELPAPRTQELLAHSAGCDACAEGWRLAAALAAESGIAASPAPRPRRDRFRVGLAVVALAASLALVAFLVPRRSAPDAVRDVGAFAIASRVETGRPLPRDACMLSWSPGPEGTLYTVEVARTDLTVIARAVQIATPSYQVPASALAGLQPGSVLLWRVEAILPDATRHSSPVFRATLQ